MKVVRNLLNDKVEISQRLVVTVGVFDGVHIGHRQVIQRVVDWARQLAEEAGVTPAHIRRLLIAGKVEGFKLSPSLWLIPAAAALAWLAKPRKPGPKPKQVAVDGSNGKQRETAKRS